MLREVRGVRFLQSWSHPAYVPDLSLLEEPLQSALLTHLSGPGGGWGGAGQSGAGSCSGFVVLAGLELSVLSPQSLKCYLVSF